MKIYKCRACNIYTLEKTCPRCGEETFGASYKPVKVRPALQQESDIESQKED